MVRRSGTLKLPDGFAKVKLWMSEVASIISLAMWLIWALWHEYSHLFNS